MMEQPGIEDCSGHYWMQTYSGIRFFPTNPRVSDIRIDDIAHALAKLERYNGHLPTRYTVAQHSILVSWCVPEKYALEGLLHDAAEAYFGDIIAPVKHHTMLRPALKQIESKLMEAISERFQLEYPLPACVKEADWRVLFTEKRDLVPGDIKWEGQDQYEPLSFKIKPNEDWRDLKTKFLDRYAALIRL
jgi:uncharacterized protein